MSNRSRFWSARVALAMPIVVSAGLSLWFTRPPAPPPHRSSAADDPAAKASDSSSSAAADPEAMEASMRRRRGEMLASQPSSINDSEAAEALLEQYAPHIWKRLQRMPADGPMRLKLQRQMTERARDLLRMQQRDPEQFKSEVEQVRLEDEVAELGRRVMRRGESPSTSSSASGDQDPLRKELRETIAKLVDVRLHNREARLERLAKTLDSEKAKLESDRGNRDKLIDRQFQTVVNSRRPFPGPGGAGEGRPPALGAPAGPRRGPGTSRPGNDAKAEVQASPARSAPDDSGSTSDDKAK